MRYAEDDHRDDTLLAELVLFLREEQAWWLAPLFFTLLITSTLIVFAEGSALSPLVYAIW